MVVAGGAEGGQAAERGDVDDAARAAGAHARHYGAGGEKATSTRKAHTVSDAVTEGEDDSARDADSSSSTRSPPHSHSTLDRRPTSGPPKPTDASRYKA
ncbi:hypothetical protein [Streptomyces himalayensis]|uniref:Uncharacterized protein n=1 Tax=Streptomyces himalayensis subsp. himalayensis TaxID=2756131 RepID=A0A7W0DUC9_9ACTN|nr:hypothetical protein [Streptomyces himalayensis]MBA2950604.1 hypothetical protein [Streptomyces himalayensis subsp. himalayensis]